jgi:tetratricopeptide (TPR) repeat protein
LLTKITVLVVLPLVVFILFYKLISDEKRSLTKIAGYFGLTGGITVGLAGWFYFRNWINFGKIFISNWDPLAEMNWWQDPGFHTYKYFYRFGEVFSAPYFSGFYSFFDSIYASFWGDSMLGGWSEYGYGPPWNYEYISAVYILSLLATMVIIFGTAQAVREAIFRADKTWLLILGLLYVAVWSIAYISLRIPYYGQSKAFYSLYVVMPVALTFAFGFDGLDKWLKSKNMLLVRTILYGWFGTLVLAIFFSYFIGFTQKEQPYDLPTLTKDGRLNEAVLYYTKLLSENPNSHYAHVELATLYINQGRFNDALEHYKKALHIRPDWPRTLNTLSRLLVNKSNATALEKKQAVIYAERCCQLTGYLWEEALVTLTDAYVVAGEPNAAIEYYNKLLQQNGDSAKLHFNLAVALNMQKKYDDSIKHLTKVLEIDPNYPGASNKMEITLIKSGKTDEAIAYFNKNLRKSKDPAEVYVKMGVVYTQAGKYELAIQSFTKAVELKPDSTNALNNLAWTLAASGEVSAENANKAIELAQRTCELTEYKRPEFLDTLAVAYAAAGRFDDAVSTAEQAVNLAKASRQEKLSSEIQMRLELYKAGQPYRQK